MRDFQGELEQHIDAVLELLEASAEAGEPVDPLATILDRMRVRGAELDLSTMPPMMQMLLKGLEA